MPTIRLRSCDGVIFTTDEVIAKWSVKIKAMLKEYERDAVVRIDNVKSPILRKVLEWVNYHRDDPVPLRNVKHMKRTIGFHPWESDFLHVNLHTLCDLVLAAENLGINCLKKETYRAIADLMNGKTGEEMGRMLKIVTDKLQPTS